VTDTAPAPVSAEEYGAALGEYLRTGGEAALYQASLISQAFVRQRVGPDDIVALHVEALERVTAGFGPRQQVVAATDALHFLLEVMIAYGVRHQEYLEMRLEQLAQSELSKTEVLRAVAHELRTPLTAARGNIDLAEIRLVEGQVHEVPPLLGQSRAALDRLVRMTADLVEASREGAPRLRLEQQAVGDLLDRTRVWAAAHAAERGVALAIEETGDPLTVVADGDALLSVFGNLLSNAIRYTPPGGRVVVRYGGTDEAIWVEVRDTGIGMVPEVRERIFEKFYRAPEAQLAVPQGLGLGLALVRQLVEAHRGRVEVESLPGRGSTFRVVLPRDPGSEETAEV
jgi:signal transduction histidine kinase